MRPRLIAPITLLAVLVLAAPALAAEANPPSQTRQFNVSPAQVSVTGLPPNTNTLFRLTRANGVVSNEWKDSGPAGSKKYGWWGKAIGTDTLQVCTDAAMDGTCDGPFVQSTMNWTQYPAIRTSKGGVAGVATAIFAGGQAVSFNLNIACQPAFFQWQAFILMAWDDATGRHRFTDDYMSTNSCTVRGDGGYDLTTFGWGRLNDGVAHPYKVIVSVPNGAPASVRLGIGGADPPHTESWDFLDGVLKGSSQLQYISG